MERIENISLIGKKFGRFTIEKFAYRKNGKAYWKCKCDCGNEVIVVQGNLVTMSSRSCGCLRTHKYEPGEAGLKSLYSKYRISAKKENRAFNLTLDEFKKLTSGNCNYCGVEPEKIQCSMVSKKTEVKNHTAYAYNGIDRIDSTKGYEKNNVTTCCLWCNIIKRERTIEEFKEHIRRITNHLNLGNIYA